MKTRLNLLTLTMLLGVVLMATPMQAAQSWDIVNNSVTDTRVLNFATPTTISISDLRQFSSAGAVTAGEEAGTYVLTSVVLSIEGSGTSMSGSFQFNNTYAVPGTINSASYAAGQGLTFSAGGLSALQTMTHTFNGGAAFELAGLTTTTENFTPTLGAAASTTVTTGLDAFVGSGYVAGSSANLAAGMSSSTAAGIFSGSFASGTATISITYNYTLVPEPTSAALLGLGCAVLALRRRRAV